jgi:prepilin-type N-terminal cleavage/methylation domain-containing protein
MRPRRKPTARAFTLAELLIVLAILALAALVVIPTLRRFTGNDEQRLRQELIEVVRSGQIAATETGLPVHVTFEPGERRVTAHNRAVVLPSGWWVRRTGEAEVNRAASGIRTLDDIAGRAPPPRVMMTWSPGGLVSETDWVVVGESGVRIRVYGNSIDGVRIE